MSQGWKKREFRYINLYINKIYINLYYIYIKILSYIRIRSKTLRSSQQSKLPHHEQHKFLTILKSDILVLAEWGPPKAVVDGLSPSSPLLLSPDTYIRASPILDKSLTLRTLFNLTYLSNGPFSKYSYNASYNCYINF